MHNRGHHYNAKIKNREYVTEVVNTSAMKNANARTNYPPLPESYIYDSMQKMLPNYTIESNMVIDTIASGE